MEGRGGDGGGGGGGGGRGVSRGPPKVMLLTLPTSLRGSGLCILFLLLPNPEVLD